MHLLDSDWIWGSWILASLGFGWYVTSKLNSNARIIEQNSLALVKLIEIGAAQTRILEDHKEFMREMIRIIRWVIDQAPDDKKPGTPPPYVREPR